MTQSNQRTWARVAEAENDRLWLADAERRLLEIQSGQVEALPGEEVLRRAESELVGRISSDFP